MHSAHLELCIGKAGVEHRRLCCAVGQRRQRGHGSGLVGAGDESGGGTLGIPIVRVGAVPVAGRSGGAAGRQASQDTTEAQWHAH